MLQRQSSFNGYLRYALPSREYINGFNEYTLVNACKTQVLRACLHGGGGPQVGEVTCAGRVTR